MPPLRGAKRRRKAAVEKKAAAAMATGAAASATGDSAPADWWDGFCMRMSGAREVRTAHSMV